MTAMKRRNVLIGAASLAATGLARPAIAQPAKVLKFVPQANLSSPDPIWTTTTVAAMHGYMVWDTLYGLDDGLLAQKQMVGAEEVSPDGLTWKLTLRDGLKFHDGEPVRGVDVIASLTRWGKRDGFGQRLFSQMEELSSPSDKVVVFRLKKPFPVLPYALGSSNSFIMPERIAKTDPFQQIPEFVGSGPFKFLRDEWNSGSSAAYAKYDGYVPRAEAPSRWSGGKVVHFDRVEWKILPDPATAAAALQTGEIDWWENPLIDLVGTLKKNKDVVTHVLDPLGALAIIAFNHLQPPFNNPKLLRALLPAINQQDYVGAVVGEMAELGQTDAGFFTMGSPFANTAGMAALTGRRDVALAKKLVAESGYKNEPVLLMSPSDQPQLQIMAQVTHSLFQSVGINSQYSSMDWGTLVTRRASKEPSDKGGWNSFCTTWGGLSTSNPGSSFPLRGNGPGGWFGWPTDAKMEELRDAWFDASDMAAQKKITEQMQLQAFENIPFMPVGQWANPTGYRKTITGVLKGSPAVFWNVRRV
jgi:peptide/nickel transport system substrate-binding protein